MRRYSRMPEISGLRHLASYISADEGDQLLRTVDWQPWLTDLSRRVQHYGYRYDYKARKVDASMYLGPLPSWAQVLAARVLHDGHVIFDQVIVNEYEPGQGIDRHVDCLPCFEDTIVSLSLGSACVMKFTHPAVGGVCDIVLEPRSLLVLQGPARREWRHEIPRRKTDRLGGAVTPRARRVSLTFRFLSGIGAALAGSMANKSSIVIDLRGWRTPSVSGEELQALGKSGPRYTAEIARGLPVPRG